MQPAFEDVFFGPGPLRVVNQERQLRWEESQRRVRVLFAGLTIADSTRVMRLQEYGRVPVYSFPLAEVRREVLEASDHHTPSPLKGEASSWRIRVGDRVAEHAAWSYLSPPPDGRPVRGYVALYWHVMDAWYEEDEQV